MKNGQAMMEPNEAVAMMDSSLTPDDDTHPMALLLEEIEQPLFAPQIGDIRKGTIVEKRSNDLLIDIGYKSEGFVNGREIDRIKEDLDSFNIGDEVPVYILREDKDGNMMLSISRAQAEQDWLRAQELLENQEMFDGEVTAHNRGGVIIKLGQVRGFVPASQLATPENSPQSSNNANGNESDESNRYAHLIGSSLKLKVIDLDRKRNRLILSERLAMREWRRKQKEELLESLKEGDVYEGTISSIADFGAFVDLGGADGLIHLSELSWNRISHPNEVVSVGSKVKVQIMAIDLERKRIGLSLRRLQPQPWELVEQKYEVGQIVRGRITKIVNFGAFARLEQDGIEGLIHISELSEDRVNHPKEVVSEGQEHDLRIIRIDIDKRRMGLSLKQALLPEEIVELDWQIAPSDTLNMNNENGQSEVATQVADIFTDSSEPSSIASEISQAVSESENGVYETDVAVEEVTIESQ